MNHRHTSFLFAALLAITFVAAPGAHAQLSPLVVTVNVQGKTDRDVGTTPKKGGVMPKVEVSEEKHLEILLTNRSANDYANLTVTYFLFASDIDTKELSVLKSGSRTTNVPGLGKAQVETESATAKYTRAYQKKSAGQLTNVPASGQKFAGYGVRVSAGQKILYEKYEPAELKDKASSAAWPEEKPKSKKRKKSED